MLLFSLGPRLSAAAELARGARSIIDVGSDHARLPVWLLSRGLINRAYAADISPCSVEKAERAARKYELSDRLFAVLSDGLSEFRAEDADTIILAGLGGDVIASILKGAPWVADGRHTLIVQCMSSLDVLNSFLADSGYRCLDQRVVCDSGRIYAVAKLRGAALEPSRKSGRLPSEAAARIETQAPTQVQTDALPEVQTAPQTEQTETHLAQAEVQSEAQSAVQPSAERLFPEFVLPSPHGADSPYFRKYIERMRVSALKAQKGLLLSEQPDPRIRSALARRVEYYDYLIKECDIK